MGGAKNKRYQFRCKKGKRSMLKKELADALGISGPMVSKLAKRGMPTDSVERAQRWRKRHLEPGRLKSNKAKGDTQKTPTPAQPNRAGGPVEVRPAPRPPAQPSPDDEDEFTGPLDGELLFQKTRETKARADKLELELAEAQGILIRVAEVRMGAFTCTRTVRDLLTCVGRNAAHKVMQATSLADCQTVIDLEIGAILDYQENRLLPDLFQRISPKLPPAGDTAPT